MLKSLFFKEDNYNLNSEEKKILVIILNNILKNFNINNFNNISINDINKLFYLNKPNLHKILSINIGLNNGKYKFDNEYSNLINTKIKDYDFGKINYEMNTNGVFLYDKLVKSDTCYLIKKKLNNLIFKTKDNKKLFKGIDILNKNINIKKYSTFWIKNMSDLLNIEEIKKLATDSFFLNIAQEYLGCKPILCQTNCWYSIKGKVESTQTYHQDYDDIKFLKIFIYLSDVKINNGPHSYISSSINNFIRPNNYKPSDRVSDDFIKNNYKKEKINFFTGNIGTTIIEDTNGFHKGTNVKEGNRLILQLQYGCSLLPLKRGYKLISNRNEFMEKYKDCFLNVFEL